MGLSPFKSCGSGYVPTGPAPNPNPSRWTLLNVDQFDHGYVLTVRYHDCTNWEGVKVMVYRGKYVHQGQLDPHFTSSPDSPVARFKPDVEGLTWARSLAKSLEPSP